MSKKRNPKKEEEYIALEDLAHRLGLLEVDVYSWVLGDKISVKYDYRHRESIKAEYLDKYSQHPDYQVAFKRSLLAQTLQRNNETVKHRSDFYRKQRLKSIEQYEEWIDSLAKLHLRYLERVNNHLFESGVIAAYLLFGRAISLLKMGCLCLKNGYWYGGSLLRQIDETLDVAHYFIVTEGTKEGEKARIKWFRQNVAPKHADCRRKLAAWASLTDPTYKEQSNKALMDELYQKKSRWIHPTFNIIREVTNITAGESIKIESLEYDQCAREYKLAELTDFFRSSIWTSLQIFLLCFKDAMPLREDDISYLMSQNELLLRLLG